MSRTCSSARSSAKSRRTSSTFSGCSGASAVLVVTQKPTPASTASELHGSPTQKPSRLPSLRLGYISSGDRAMMRTWWSGLIFADLSQWRSSNVWVEVAAGTPNVSVLRPSVWKISRRRLGPPTTPRRRRSSERVMALPCRLRTMPVTHSHGSQWIPSWSAKGMVARAWMASSSP